MSDPRKSKKSKKRVRKKWTLGRWVAAVSNIEKRDQRVFVAG